MDSQLTSSWQYEVRDRANKAGSLDPKLIYLVFSILILASISLSVFIHPLYTLTDVSDFWEHSATIQKKTKNLWNPGNPHLAIDIGTPRYMPFFFLLSALAGILELNPIQALGIGGVLTTILLLSGIWLALSLYFRNEWAPLVGLIVFLCGWGASWNWSNNYQLKCLFYIIGYPSSFAFALSFFSFWLSIRVLRKQEKGLWECIALGFMAALIFLSHPPTGVFAICLQFLLALLEPNARFGHRIKLIATVIIGALAAELWPYFSLWQVVLGKSGAHAGSWVEASSLNVSRFGELVRDQSVRSWFYNPQQVLITLGPAVLGIPVLIYLCFKREQLFIVAGFVLMSAPFLTNLIYSIPLGHRFLFYMVFYLHLSVIWVILTLQSKAEAGIQPRTLFGKKKIRLMIIFAMTLCVWWNLFLVALEFSNYSVTPKLEFHRIHRKPIVNDMLLLAPLIPNEAIVLAPMRLSWVIPTFFGKVVGLFHDNPMVANDHLRHSAIHTFFRVNTTKETRLEILRRYKVTHILYRRENIPKPVRDDLNLLGAVIIVNNYVIVQL
jgi:hypothetical protein